jgi:hypothetical protein
MSEERPDLADRVRSRTVMAQLEAADHVRSAGGRRTSSQSTHRVVIHMPHQTAPIHQRLESDSRLTINAIGPTVPAMAQTT